MPLSDSRFSIEIPLKRAAELLQRILHCEIPHKKQAVLSDADAVVIVNSRAKFGAI